VKARLTILLTAVCLPLAAQRISGIRVSQQANDVVVAYRLDGEAGKAYHISLHASHDNFGAALRLVEGDVGEKRVLPGAEKSIRWRALDELKSFDGDISFELRAVAAPPLFTSIATSAGKVKRGSEVTITWKGGGSENVSVELVKGEKAVQAGTAPNTGKFAYAVPKKLKPGSYSVVLKQGSESVRGEELAVKARIPFWMKLAPIVLGVAVWQLWPGPEEETFPEPPDLTQ
jgi:hypothetical protein